MSSAAVDDYRPDDEPSWLRCRVLSFLATSYFDDVVTRKPDADAPVQLVVREGDAVVGLLDASLDGPEATIEAVAVHPDHRGRGLGTALLETALERLRPLGATGVEAWTRDDAATLRWYAARGFTESDHYLHVYASAYADDLADTAVDAFRSATDLRAVTVFAHAPIEQEARMRATYRRVHVCRRMHRRMGA